MKTSLKVFLLSLAIAAVAGSLLFFAKLRLDPPRAVSHDGEQAALVRRMIDNVHQGLDSDTLDQRWFAAHHLIGFLTDNQLLRPGESDTLKVMLMEKYVPAFVRKCELKFGWSVWEDSDLKKMRQRIQLLKGIENSDKHAIVDLRPSVNGQLDRVLGVLNRYRQACDLAERRDFKSIADSKDRIREARRYQSDAYLSKNTHLMHELDSVPTRLQEAHYRYLERCVASLANPGTSWEAFQERYDGVGREVSLFADSARAVYGHYMAVGDLHSDMRSHYHAADREFNNKSAWDILLDKIF